MKYIKIFETKKTETYLKIFHWDWNWYPYFVYVGTKHKKTFIISLWFFDIDIEWSYKDWMILDKELYLRKYKSWKKNPEYVNEETENFAFPIIRKKIK